MNSLGSVLGELGLIEYSPHDYHISNRGTVLTIYCKYCVKIVLKSEGVSSFETPYCYLCG